MDVNTTVPERRVKLEKYEWSNMWWDEPEMEGRRVLLVGDSITNGYSPALKKIMPPDIYIDKYVTSRALNNPSFLKELTYVLTQGKYEVIHFNNGLHGGLDKELFKKCYEEVIKYLLSLENSPKIIISGTTPVVVTDKPNEYTPFNAKSIERDSIAREIAEKYGLMYENLYNLVDGIEGIRAHDPFHYNEKGCEILANAVCKNLKKVLNI